MAFVHRFVCQHGLANDVADGEDVRHVGAHLNVYVDEAPIGHIHTGFIGGNLLAVRRAAHGLQHQVIHLRRRCALAFKRHFNAFGHGAG